MDRTGIMNGGIGSSTHHGGAAGGAGGKSLDPINSLGSSRVRVVTVNAGEIGSWQNAGGGDGGGGTGGPLEVITTSEVIPINISVAVAGCTVLPT